MEQTETMPPREMNTMRGFRPKAGEMLSREMEAPTASLKKGGNQQQTLLTREVQCLLEEKSMFFIGRTSFQQ